MSYSSLSDARATETRILRLKEKLIQGLSALSKVCIETVGEKKDERESSFTCTQVKLPLLPQAAFPTLYRALGDGDAMSVRTPLLSMTTAYKYLKALNFSLT